MFSITEEDIFSPPKHHLKGKFSNYCKWRSSLSKRQGQTELRTDVILCESASLGELTWLQVNRNVQNLNGRICSKIEEMYNFRDIFSPKISQR